MFFSKDHTFVVCAYGESPFLGECLKSLAEQNVLGAIILATSTPSEHIVNMAEAFGVSVRINPESNGIASDWNFAIACAQTPLVTIAHQDDVYLSSYLEDVLNAINQSTDPLIAFTDYHELRQGEITTWNKLLAIKKILLKPLTSAALSKTKFFKRRSLSLGNPICCPSVTYVLSNLTQPLFHDGFRSNLDWDAWERFSRLPGSFVYLKKNEMLHRIHDNSETSSCIVDDVRTAEDLDLLQRFWPDGIARLINHAYRDAQDSNQ